VGAEQTKREQIAKTLAATATYTDVNKEIVKNDTDKTEQKNDVCIAVCCDGSCYAVARQIKMLCVLVN
jgi:hypothetical protein